MKGGLRRLAAFVLFVCALIAPLPSHAFCGFYVNTSDQPMFNDATQVVMMRAGMRTVLSIQNDYKGPLDSFALVVPVPIVLERENVRTLPPALFERVERLTSPRLVEYWEQDPCERVYDDADDKEGGTGTRAKGEEGSMGNPGARPLVVVERRFSVDEYDVVILSARDSGALDTWLRENEYVIPPGAEPYLRPYVQEGSKFFVAKVDIHRVTSRWNRAQLSPLRFHYDTPEFKLPVRLGLINSSGTQDLIVHVLGAKRYETANYENLFIPTNIGVKEEVRNQFNSFYASLFDRTLVGHPRAVVTEYAWSPQSCDPCPAGAAPLADDDAKLLGLDVISTPPPEMVLTRLHARYGKDALGDDLVFREAGAVVGGRESRDAAGELSQTPRPDSSNAFQGRYILRHPWAGKVTCSSPSFGVWGGPPHGDEGPPPRANPHADRNLPIEDLMLGPKAERRLHSSGSGDPRWLLIVKHVVRPQDWSGEEVWVAALVAYAASFFGAIVYARRRRTGVWKTIGLFAALTALAAVVGYAAECRHFGDSRAWRGLVQQPHVHFMTAVMLGGVAAARGPRRALWVLLPLAGGLARAAVSSAQAQAEMSSYVGVDLDMLGRIFAEIGQEALEPLILGAAVTGAFAAVAAVLSLERGEGGSLRRAGAALAVAVLARALLVGGAHGRLPMDVLAVLAMTAALLVILRADRFEPVLFAVTSVLLLDIGARLLVSRSGLDAATYEAVDPSQLHRILTDTVMYERRRLGVIAIDLGLLIGLYANVKRPRVSLDWRIAAALGASALLAATAFEWLGLRQQLRTLDARQTRPSLLGGPALFVDERGLSASPKAEVAPVPYGPRVADAMLRADAGAPPLLFAPAHRAFGSLFEALAPFLRASQSDYRLVADRPSDPELGIYGVLLSTRNVVVTPVDLRPELAIGAGRPSSEAKPTVVLKWDGAQFQVRTVELRGGTLIPDGTRQPAVTLNEIEQIRHGGSSLRWMMWRRPIIVVIAGATPLETVNDLLSKLARAQVGDTILSPDVAAYDRL